MIRKDLWSGDQIGNVQEGRSNGAWAGRGWLESRPQVLSLALFTAFVFFASLFYLLCWAVFGLFVCLFFLCIVQRKGGETKHWLNLAFTFYLDRYSIQILSPHLPRTLASFSVAWSSPVHHGTLCVVVLLRQMSHVIFMICQSCGLNH